MTTAPAAPLATRTMRARSPVAIGGRDAAVALLPLLAGIRLNAGVTLFLLDFVLLLIVIITALHGSLRLSLVERRLAMLAAGWLASQVLTDFIQQVPFRSTFVAVSVIILTITNYLGFRLLVGSNPRRIRLAAASLALGFIVGVLLYPTPLTAINAWKFGLAIPASILAVLVITGLSRGNRPVLDLTLLSGFSVAHLLLGVRSAAALCILAGGVAFIVRTHGHGAQTRRVIAALALVVLAATAFFSYASAANSGVLGYEARQKYQSQSQGRFGLILGARSEIVFSWQAIQERPLLGHGSTNEISRETFGRGVATLARQGVQYSPNSAAGTRIPTHSHIFDAWVKAGLLGALFWAAVLVVAVRRTIQGVKAHHTLSLLVSFLACGAIYDILYSPYGLERRLLLPFTLLILIGTTAEGRASNV